MTRGAVRGVLLAGGDSTRFGAADKSLASIDGIPMIQRAAAVLREATGLPPVVAAGSNPPASYRDVLASDIRFVPDAERPGPLAGIAGAADALDDPWLFAVATDMPRLDAGVVAWLLDRRDDGLDAVAPVDAEGVPQPLCACYRTRAVRDALAADDSLVAPRDLLDRLDARLLAPADAPPDLRLADALANVNTRADLRAAEE